MKAAKEFVDEFLTTPNDPTYSADEELEKLLHSYGEEVRKQIIAVINEARQEGEWDIRSVRTRIERMKIE